MAFFVKLYWSSDIFSSEWRFELYPPVGSGDSEIARPLPEDWEDCICMGSDSIEDCEACEGYDWAFKFQTSSTR